MTNASTTHRADPIVLAKPDGRVGRAGALVISAGTPFQIVVRDARSLYRWSERGPAREWDDPRIIVYHHTVNAQPARRSSKYELDLLIMLAHGGRWGVPYNFVVMPYPPFRIYYLNDVDHLYPHTLGYNHATAIAAYGNYSAVEPDGRMVRRMVALADALATMWGEWVAEYQHRDVMPTECPGNLLSPLLPAMNRQRGT